MKIARFSTGDAPRFGIVKGVEADGTPTGDAHLLVLKGDPLFSVPEATGEVVRLDDVRLLAPVIPRSKVVGIGKNYLDHVREMGGADAEPPAAPVVFLKPNTAVIGPDAPIVLPAWSDEVHYEAEMAVVIKTLVKDVSPEDAHSVIMGYTVANDVSARDRQRSEPQWVRAKAFDTSCPLGPWIEVPEPATGPFLELDGGAAVFDPAAAVVRTRVDGQVVQEGTTTDMVRGVPELVSYISSIFTLLPGDVILTGTPAGVGEIRSGQRVEVEVEGIGSFSNPVVRR